MSSMLFIFPAARTTSANAGFTKEFTLAAMAIGDGDGEVPLSRSDESETGPRTEMSDRN